VYDEITGQLLQHHEGHNSATNSMLVGIGHYLMGDGVLNQGSAMLEHWVPQYISLGTMGLYSQGIDAQGLPTGIGYSASASEEQNFIDYARCTPGFGADGYSSEFNNGRPYFGIGPMFDDRPPIVMEQETFTVASSTGPWQFNTRYLIESIISVYDGADDITAYSRKGMYGSVIVDPGANLSVGDTVIIKYTREVDAVDTVDCELISKSFPRAQISYRKLLPTSDSELPRTVDIVLSAMISTGALKQFRDIDPATGERRKYLFITEAGLWSKKWWPTDSENQIDYMSGDNGLVAGYRIMPPNASQQDMSNPENRAALKKEILRVGWNQVVQVVWKLQLGSINEFQSANNTQ
jgi:hypothetical protein